VSLGFTLKTLKSEAKKQHVNLYLHNNNDIDNDSDYDDDNDNDDDNKLYTSVYFVDR